VKHEHGAFIGIYVADRTVNRIVVRNERKP
jgi:hypothetical protein